MGVKIQTLLNAVTSGGAGTALKLSGGDTTHNAMFVVTGIAGDTVVLQGSVDNSNWVTCVILDGSTAASLGADGSLAIGGHYPFVRGNVTSYGSGTITASLVYLD